MIFVGVEGRGGDVEVLVFCWVNILVQLTAELEECRC